MATFLELQMSDLDSFRESVGRLLKRAEDEAAGRRALSQRNEGRRNEMLLRFDRYADEIQDSAIAPRLSFLASQFRNSQKPVMREEFEYRHRIELHFTHTDEFPCIADLTFLIVHCEVQEFLSVKFEYVILPAYVTDNFKFTDSIQVRMDEASYPAVERFVESCLETFLAGYLKARAV